CLLLTRPPATCRLLAILLIASPALISRANFVVPQQYATTEGNTNEGFAGLFGSNPYTNQIQIAASELAAQNLQIGDAITGIGQRLDHDQPAGPATALQIDDLEITCAEATHTIGQMTNTYALNMINPVMVHDGPFTMAANAMPAGGSPNPFG